MEKRLLKTIICLSIFTCTVAKAQGYVPFPDSNAVWNEFAGQTVSGNHIITICGDSIYNGHTYKKYCLSFDTTGLTLPGALVSLVRQDIPNKKVFVIMAGSSNERVLYNFGLNVNDTITVYNFFMNGLHVNLKVDVKDSILINGQYRKRLQLKNNSTLLLSPAIDYWVEGIGSMFGVFNTGYNGLQVTDVENYQNLVCFTKNGVKEFSLYGFSPSSSCFMHLRSGVGIEKQSIQQSLFKICPNPTAGILNIEINAELKKQSSINITDALGRILKQLSINATTKIDLTDVKEGIYFLQVFEDGRLVGSENIVRE